MNILSFQGRNRILHLTWFVFFLTLYSLMPAGPAADRTFFQVLGIAGVMVAFLCAFFLKKPKGSFAEFHEGEEDLEPVAQPVANPNHSDW